MILYRITDQSFLSNKLYPDRYTVIKETPCGYWIYSVPFIFSGYKRWISKNANNRFARETIKDALEDYLYRKKYERKRLMERLEYVEHLTETAKEELLKCYEEKE